ncbi:MAG TPA: hypothetical protein PKL35_07980 [Methanoregulaceae archaeon]|nr:hypothetical protein [Methanoregulaceae archaeon]HOW33533.1 hypothetical protein [Methanoregulaceae archaeon]
MTLNQPLYLHKSGCPGNRPISSGALLARKGFCDPFSIHKILIRAMNHSCTEESTGMGTGNEKGTM